MRISVVIPLYNKRSTILRALNSVLNQKILPDEVIVVNDGSTDGSEQIVAELNHPLVRLFHQNNSGVSVARNRGIYEAQGDWIAFLDADDEWLFNFLERINDLHVEFTKASILASNYFVKIKNLQAKVIRRKELGFDGESGILVNYFKIAANSTPPLWSSAIVIKKGILIDKELFKIGVTAGEDLLAWAKLVIEGNIIAYCVTPLSTFHFDNENHDMTYPKRVPQTPDVVGQELKKLIYLVKDKKKSADLKSYIALWHKMRASTYFKLKKNALMVKEIKKSLSYNPFQFKIIMFMIINLMPDVLRKPIIRYFSSY